ncbi:protein disulfide isomerase [Anaeramoeba flamelloides]|uniref:protein disulfide-isomerase n=1 Tax=Anaeramoeba flamelloides TaxID=1746091 RepID=A0ABQ8ZA81_9EUKA|nr:protein disulfide isomerase [Anaeramoeba flamelloides]
MKIFLYFTLFLILSVAFCKEEKEEEKTETEKINYLSVVDVKKLQKKEKDFFLLISAEFAPSSREFETVFKEIIAPFVEKDLFEFQYYDYQQEDREFAMELGLKALPSLVLFKDGKHVDSFNDGFAEELVRNWIAKHHLPTISKIENEEDLEDFKTKYSLVVYAEFPENKKTNKMLKKIAKKKSFSNYVFTMKNGEESVLKLLRNKDSKEIVYDGEWKSDLIEEFLDINHIPFLQQLTRTNYEEYFEIERPIGFVFFNLEDEKNDDEEEINFSELPTNKLISEFEAEYTNKIWFAWSNAEDVKGFAEKYGLETYPGIVIIDNKNNQYYRFEEEWGKEGLEKFFKSFLEGKLEPSIRSQPIPEENDGPVKKVVRKNWDEIVNDPEKDVFVKVYAEWCGHCKQLAPVYEELAKKFAKVENLVIAEIDGANNDLGNGASVTGFPTLIFFPAKDKMNFVTYQGGRTLEDMAQYLKQTAKTADFSVLEEEKEEKEEKKEKKDKKKKKNKKDKKKKEKEL